MNLDYTSSEKNAIVISYILSEDTYMMEDVIIPTENGYSKLPGGFAIAKIINNNNNES